MENAVLCVIMILLFVFGYFVMDRLGRCMNMLYRHAEDQTYKARGTGIIFTEEKSSAEIDAEIEHLRDISGKDGAIVFISEDSELYDRLADRRSL